jgi:hypothetical protein
MAASTKTAGSVIAYGGAALTVFIGLPVSAEGACPRNPGNQDSLIVNQFMVHVVPRVVIGGPKPF